MNDFAKRIDPVAGYKVIQAPREIIPLEEAFQEDNSQKLVIVDDFASEKNQHEIIKYFFQFSTFQLLIHLSFPKLFENPKKYKGCSISFLQFSF